MQLSENLINNFLSLGLRWVLGVRSFVFFKALCGIKTSTFKNPFLPTTLLLLFLCLCLCSGVCCLTLASRQRCGYSMDGVCDAA